jgi:DNA-binding LytR/AlgR family response regulator
MIRTVIIDDEPLAREELCFLLKEVDDVTIVGQAENGHAALEIIHRLTPDLILLDIQMPGMDGFQLIEEMIFLEHLPAIIFTTAYDRYAMKAFEVSAVDYLLKPIEKGRLEKALQKVRNSLRAGRASVEERLEALLRSLDQGRPKVSRISIKKGDRYIPIDVEDIVYAYISDGVVYARLEKAEGMLNYRTIEELELDLDPRIFQRVHRSYIANIHRITEIIPWFSGTYQLKMNDDRHTEIPLSRAQAKKLRRLLKW